MKNEAFNIDCMDYMRKCSDKQFDIAIVDPPYGNAETAFGSISTKKQNVLVTLCLKNMEKK